MVPHRLEKGKSVSEDAGPRRGVDCDVPQSHIDWRKERVSARTLGPEGEWITTIYKGVETFSSRRVLKS